MAHSDSLVISTNDLPAEERTRTWISQVQKYVIDIDCPVANPEAGINARLEHTECGPISINRIDAGAHSVQRSANNIHQDERQSVFLCAMLEGQGYSWQGTRCANHSPGDVVLYDTSHPYGHGFPADMSMFVVNIPKAVLEPHIGQWQESDLIKLDRSLRVGNASCESIHSLLASHNRNHCYRAVITEHILEQLGTLLGANRLNSHDRVQHALLQRALTYIDEHLQDDTLDTEQVSQAMRISPRHLSRIFEMQGKTISRYIWNQRLERCREDLMANTSESISQIAFRWGFNHSAHFSRSYKQRFGITPSQTRNGLS
ncbi:helix-turn-helix domain-containing protein [Oceanobacter kriegii]|uniref:helix-turn-helix domain-containing protein n=1 Tax=Oceanobacter kriegii TaxID=64972 RepID=UPI00040EABFF|nr:helix-turn-helix domain-containing protein [Oceanobacter kriegii]